MLLLCNFNFLKLPLDLPRYCKECLIAWASLNNANPSTVDEIVNQITWNNEYTGIDDKSVFNKRIFSRGLCKVSDLFELVCITPRVLDLLYLKRLYHSFSPERKSDENHKASEVLPKTKPYNGGRYSAAEILSTKKIYKLFISKISKPPTAKKKFDEHYASNGSSLDWGIIYSIPFECAIDTKSREFQYKVLNRILPFNEFLFKIGKSDSPLCSFCQETEESMPHLFFSALWYNIFGNQFSLFLEMKLFVK